MDSALMLILLLVLLLSGLPVAISLGLSGLVFFILSGGPLGMVPHCFYAALDSYTLICIPLFILMGEILFKARLSDDLFDFVQSWIGHLPGGLGIVSILACAFFAAISGSSVANAATMGRISIPAMISRGYEKRFVVGLLAAGGTIGILLPPSIPLIIYGSMTGVSIMKLFAAALIPGILLTITFILYCVYVSYRKEGTYKRLPKASWSQRLSATRKAFFGLLIPPIVLGGIYFGIFTVTEAAAIGCSYSFIVTYFIMRRISLSDVPQLLLDTLKTSSMVGLIIAGATIYGHYITLEQVPQNVASFLGDIGLIPTLFLLLASIMFIVMGCFLEVISIILLTLPILYPVTLAIGISPFHFAILMTVTLELALITPPVGVNLYVIQGITLDMDISFKDIIWGVIPFAVILVLFLLIIVFFPVLSVWLPSLM